MGDDLLRTLAHELRNAIAPIVNAAHLLRLRHGGDPEQAKILAIIDRQVAAMTRTLEAVGDADRLQRGELSLQRRRVELAAVLDAAIQRTKALIEARGQAVRVGAPAHRVWVEADEARLAQAIGNVLENAARYSDEGSEISVEIAPDSDRTEIRIQDRGRGIPADVLPHVFEAFALRHPARSGLGLGLAIARAVCELHGGSLSVRSEGEGRGSEVRISVPRAPEEPQRATGPSHAPDARRTPQSPGRRILVADDNQAVRNSFAAILREMGHDVRLAADGVQAVELAESWSPEFVIVDVHMPKIDGYAVARKLRARFAPDEMRLVMMSGTDLDPMTLLGAKQAGFDHCVDKTRAVQGLDALLRGETPPLHA